METTLLSTDEAALPLIQAPLEMSLNLDDDSQTIISLPSLSPRDEELRSAMPLHERLSGKGFSLMRRRSRSVRDLRLDTARASEKLTRTKTLSNLSTSPNNGLSAEKAMDMLGVTEETMRIEKGMKKLGICDHDIAASLEIRRHCGVILKEPETKKEAVLGFSIEQVKRIKAINMLGTSESEILDVYCKQMSDLGVPHSTHP